MSTNKIQFAFFIILIFFSSFLLFKKTLLPNILLNLSAHQKTPNIPFPQIALVAKSAYVWDIQKQKALFALNENESLPLASITKMMTALTAYESLPAATTVQISQNDLNDGQGNGLRVGEKWKLKDLIDFTLTISSNDGALAIAEAGAPIASSASTTQNQANDFLMRMNNKAKELGLNNTYFMNQSGLDISKNVAGAYGSARDVANLFSYIEQNHPELFDATKHPTLKITSLSGITHVIKNTDIALDNIPGLIASKTGLTDLAGGNLAVIFDADFGHPIVIVVLGSTADGRFTDVQALSKATLQYLELNQ
jgi:D-alanyl-D-alanine carboxypeptidase